MQPHIWAEIIDGVLVAGKKHKKSSRKSVTGATLKSIIKVPLYFFATLIPLILRIPIRLMFILLRA